MAYRFMEEGASGDVGFEAASPDIGRLFEEAAEALAASMIDDVSSIRKALTLPVKLAAAEPDILLHDLLQEIIFHKDAKQLLLVSENITVARKGGEYELTGMLAGETIDFRRHRLLVDVKAVTFHGLTVEERDGGWYCSVILDT